METKGPSAEILTLFDFLWFYLPILSKHHPPPPPPVTYPPTLPLNLDPDGAESHETTDFPPPISRQSTSTDDLAPPPESRRVLLPKLQTIISGKESATGSDTSAAGSDGEARRRRRQRQRRSRGVSRSMSDLEFEELKGFMDLGFTFSDAEADPRLMSIVPGLQRRRRTAEGGGELESEVAEELIPVRPYLSEAWAGNIPPRGWKIPSAVKDGVDLKEHIRVWAHTVASTVR